MKKFAILSDIHFGQNGTDGSGYVSLLSRPEVAPEEFQAVLTVKQESLAQTLANFAGPDKIVLVGCGDILDLAMSHMRTALEDLVALLRKLPMVGEFVYVVGNHDHHIWAIHSELARSTDRMIAGEMPLPGAVFEPTAPSGMISEPLTRLLSTQLGRPIQVSIAYPILRLDSPDGRMVLMHGHLFGDIYTKISDILRPYIKDPNRLRVDTVVNAPTTEFVDWLIGEFGDGMGADGLAETVYADIEKGKASSVNALIDRAVDVLLPDGIVKGIPDSWERWLTKKISKRLIAESIPHLNIVVSADRHADKSGTRAAAAKWLADVLADPEAKVFVFGHTHLSDDFQADVAGIKVRCLNPGGWEIEPAFPTPDSKVVLVGKAIFLVDV